MKQQHKFSLPHCIFSSHNLALERTNDSKAQYHDKPVAGKRSKFMEIKQSKQDIKVSQYKQ
jgi:hypothetical protein